MTRATILIALAACTGSPNYWRTYTPASGHTSQSKASLVQKATIAIVDAGHETESSDAVTGLVVSKWFHLDGFAADQSQFRVRVSVDDSGGYQVVAQCQRKTTEAFTAAAWEDCSTNDRPQIVIDLV